MKLLRRSLPVLIGVMVCLLSTGCAITRKSASIDSTSRMPWLGLELAPKRSEPAPETRRIRQDHSVSVGVKPAKLVANGKGKEASWWQRLAGTEKLPVMTLPRTDVAVSGPMEVETDPEPVQATDSLEFW